MSTANPLHLLQGVSHPAVPTGGSTGNQGPTQRRTLKQQNTAPTLLPKHNLQTTTHTTPPHKKLIQNLQQQVALLEQENNRLKNTSQEKADKPRTQENPQSDPMESQKSKYEMYRLSSLESQKAEEKAKLIEQLQRVREQFASSQQELTAEAVGLQSALEQKTVVEKALRAELDVTKQKLNEVTEFSEGADTQVRLLKSEIDELKAEIARATTRDEHLRKELGSEQLRAVHLQSKMQALSDSAGELRSQRKEAENEAEEAGVKLRLVQIQLEQESRGRKEAEDRQNFLVRENAKLKGTLAELTVSTESFVAEVERMRRENESAKLSRAMAKYMVRKMQQSKVQAIAARDQMSSRLEGMHADRVKQRQRSDLLENELLQEKQRATIVADHYAQQEADAAQLTAENRMLLDRVEQLNEANQMHKTELDSRRDRIADLEAELRTANERADITTALRGLRVDSLAQMSKSNMAFATSIDGLLKALPKLEASPAPI